jgi:hypothetical protein
VSRGLKDFSRGLNDLLRGLKDLSRGLNDLSRGLKDLSRGLKDLSRGLKDLSRGQQCCGYGMFIPDPDFYPSRIPGLGSRIPDPKTATKDRGEKKLVVKLFL